MTSTAVAPRPRSSTTAPPRRTPDLAERLILEVATARDARAGIRRLIKLLRRSGIRRVEWWAPSDAGHALRLEVSDGDGRGARNSIPLGPAGVLVLVSGASASEVMSSLTRVVPILRGRWSQEQLTEQVTLLARQNEALEDFAALVAHELKSSLYAALRQADQPSGVEDALELLDSILEIARTESASGASAPVARCLEEALDDLGDVGVDVVADVPATLPIPPGALRLLLRNLIGNAVAADATHIRVSADSNPGEWTLLVDDDGVGLEAPTGYATGSGIGFTLCRRLVARLGGVLELTPRPDGGTRATLRLARR